jgi:hypothetical protein
MLNNLTNFYNIIKGRMLRTSTTIAPTDIIPLGVVNPNYGGGYAPSAITVEELALAVQPNAPSLQDVTNEGDTTSNNITLLDGAAYYLENGSLIREGSVERFGLTGISRVCSAGYEIQFVNGVEYYFPIGDSAWQANSFNGDIPNNNFDSTQGFREGCIFNDLKNKLSYLCTDASADNAVWLPMGGQYESTLNGESGAITKAYFEDAYYSINNGMVEGIIYGTLDLDFSIDSKGTFKFTLPIVNNSKVSGIMLISNPNPANGIIIEDATLLCRDSAFIENDVPFVAKFTYQAW